MGFFRGAGLNCKSTQTRSTGVVDTQCIGDDFDDFFLGAGLNCKGTALAVALTYIFPVVKNVPIDVSAQAQ